MKRALSIIVLITALAAILLMPSCKQDDSENLLNDKLSGVYSTKTIELPDGYEADLFNMPKYVNGNYIVEAIKYNENGPDEYKKFSFDTNGGNITEYTGDTSLKGIEAVNNGAFVMQEYVLDGGYTAYTESYYDSIKLTMYLTIRDADGNVLFSKEIPNIFDYDMTKDLAGFEDVFTFHGAVSVKNGESFVFVALTSEGMCAFDETGALLWTETKQRNPTALVNTDIGLLFLSGDIGKQTLKIVNAADGSMGDTVEMPESLGGLGNDTPTFQTGVGFDLYVKNRIALWGVNFEKNDDGSVECSVTEVVNWVNSNISPSEIYRICIADPQTMAATYTDALSSNKLSHYVMVMNMVPEDEVVEKEIITLANFSQDWYAQFAITKFNRESETHRIVVTDFLQYNEEQRKIKFDTEIAAGRIPDIVLYGQYSNMDPTLDTYIRSGIFTDLTPLLKADETFNYDELLGYVTKPFMLYDGKQQIFPIGMSMDSYIGKASYFDGPVTPQEMVQMHKELPDGQYMYTYEAHVKFNCIRGNFYSYVDYDTDTCSFGDGGFAELLKMLDYIDESRVPNLEYSKVSEMREYFRNDKLLLMEYYSPNSLYDWKVLESNVDDKIVNVGYPNDDKKVIANRISSDFAAITESSDNKAAAVDFIEVYMNLKRTFSHDVYKGYSIYYGSDIDTQLELFEGKTIVRNDNNISVVDDTALENAVGDRFKVTKEDAEAFKAYLDNVDAYMRYDTPIYQIYQEESNSASGYDPDTLAKNLQSRASIFLAEQSKK